MTQKEQMMKELLLDYEQLAKKLLEQMPGNIEAISLQVFLDEYVSFVERNRAPKTAEGVRLVCKKLLAYFSPARKIDTIKLKDAEQFLDQQKISAPLAIYNYFRILRAAFNKAVEWNYLRENVIAKVKLPKRQLNKPAFLTEPDLVQLTEKINNETIKDIVTAGFYSGLRIGELVCLRWKNVDLKKRVLVVGDSKFQVKNRKVRSVPICDKLLTLLENRKLNSNKSEFVFPKRSGFPYSVDCVSKNFKRACRACSFDENLHAHSLRHSFGSYLVQKGVSLYAVKELMGHSALSTTQIYSHLNFDNLKAAIDTFN